MIDAVPLPDASTTGDRVPISESANGKRFSVYYQRQTLKHLLPAVIDGGQALMVNG
ncbi:MAG: hypothetical protein EBE86_014970 [Hormoscilla sp. GUM202]|nr:hypothetical protein [Hormoscilla sp. GUM202]